MTNLLVCVLAILLCLVNAAVWTFISELPLMGIAWLLAAGLCIKLEQWRRG